MRERRARARIADAAPLEWKLLRGPVRVRETSCHACRHVGEATQGAPARSKDSCSLQPPVNAAAHERPYPLSHGCPRCVHCALGACPRSPTFDTQVHNGQCPICIEDFDEGERVWRMPCAHAACEDCLEPYLKPFIDTSAAVGGKGQSAYAYAMCALCRAAFDPEEQKAADLAQSEDRGRREQENAPPTPQANVTVWVAPRTANVAPPLRGSDAVFRPLGITALAEGSQAGGSTPLTPEIAIVPDVSATLFCAGLSDIFCGTDGRRSVAKRRRPDSGRAGAEPATYG